MTDQTVVTSPPEPAPVAEPTFREYVAERKAMQTPPEPVPAAPVAPPAPPPAPVPSPVDEAQKASEAAKVLAERSHQSKFEKRKAELQAEIDALTRTKHDLMRDIESRKTTPTPPAPPAPSPMAAAASLPDTDPSDPKPDISTYDTYEAGVEAVAEWVARKQYRALRAAEQKDAEAKAAAAKQTADEQAASEAQAKINQVFGERLATFIEAHPDWSDVVGGDGKPVTPPMDQFIRQAESGPAIAYYLGQHPEECQAIAALTDPYAVWRRLGHLEAKLESSQTATAAPSVPAVPATPPSPPPPPVSTAPAPIAPVTGQSVVTAPSTDTDDYQTYKRARLSGRT